MEPLSLVLLGGLLALDETSFGQFMVSRPIVAGALAGWVLGDPMSGFLVGGILECVYLPRLHVGGALFPDGVPATVTAAAVYAQAPGAGALAVALVAGLAIGEMGGRTIGVQRRLVSRLVPAAGQGGLSPRQVERSHLAAVALDGLRGTMVTALGVVGVAPIAAWLARHWPLTAEVTTSLIWALAALGVGMLFPRLSGVRGVALLLAGVAVAAGVLL